ncbi:MAG: hypothetical protein Q4E88_06875 [Coriobacteriia bacterium]|nr:hypothetical protein [Coriobacteriia bacterium]
MNTIDQISVFLENREGQLSGLLGLLADNNIDIYALNIPETEDYGVLKIIVKDIERTFNILKKENYVVVKTPIFLVGVPNKMGGLKGLVDAISEAGINIEYMYSMIDSNDGNAYMAIAVDDNDAMIRGGINRANWHLKGTLD